jgi:hypothetical protein
MGSAAAAYEPHIAASTDPSTRKTCFTMSNPTQLIFIRLIWTPPDVQGLFGVMSKQIRLQVYIWPVLQAATCGP